ncbi:MAG: diguanylate cyclase, partial [Treponema sp.]|nr:diguanylate cyclase [Treponema sp.]
MFGALYVIDLDNFKQVNDRLGHSFGDNAICDTANKLTLVF